MAGKVNVFIEIISNSQYEAISQLKDMQKNMPDSNNIKNLLALYEQLKYNTWLLDQEIKQEIKKAGAATPTE